MKSEAKTWDALQRAMAQQGLDPVRVENAVMPGTPDVNYVEGWIERKYLQAWPVKVTTKVRFERFTPLQSSWLWRRWAAGGASWLMLHVGEGLTEQALLFAGCDAHAVRKGLTQVELQNLCMTLWFPNSGGYQNLHSWLRRDMTWLAPNQAERLLLRIAAPLSYSTPEEYHET